MWPPNWPRCRFFCFLFQTFPLHFLLLSFTTFPSLVFHHPSSKISSITHFSRQTSYFYLLGTFYTEFDFFFFFWPGNWKSEQELTGSCKVHGKPLHQLLGFLSNRRSYLLNSWLNAEVWNTEALRTSFPTHLHFDSKAMYPQTQLTPDSYPDTHLFLPPLRPRHSPQFKQVLSVCSHFPPVSHQPKLSLYILTT